MIGEAAALAAAACWSIGSLLFERIGRTAASPGAMNLGKSSSACAILFGASLIVHRGVVLDRATPRELWLLAASAVVGMTIGDTAFFGGLVRLGATRAVLLLSTAPLFVVLIEAVLRGHLPPGAELGGIALTLAGLLLVLRPRGGEAPRQGTALGVWLGLLAGLCQAVGSLMSRAATQGAVDPLTASWARLLVTVVTLLLAGLATRSLGAWTRELFAGRTFLRIGAASFFGTVCGLFLAQVGLARATSGGIAATLLATSPVFALPLAHVTGAERATWSRAAGVALAVAGIAVLTLWR